MYQCYKLGGLSRGYTLIELMISLVIITILGSISVGYYGEYIKNGYRAEVKSTLLQAANALERYRTENNTYEDFNLADSGIVDDIAERYEVTTTVLTASTYTITAAPVAGSVMEGDGDYTLAHTGAKTYQGSNGWGN